MTRGRPLQGGLFGLAVLIAVLSSSAHAVEEIATVDELVDRG